MASSDSEEFASADEATLPSGQEQRRRRSKRQSSSNYDSEDGAGGRVTPGQTGTGVLSDKTTAVPVVAATTDGWGDFDVEAETYVDSNTKPTQPNTKSTQPITKSTQPNTMPVQANIEPAQTTNQPSQEELTRETAVSSNLEKTKETTPEPQKVTSTEESGDGWDKFDDWGQDEQSSDQPVSTEPSKQTPEEEKIKSVADRLSGLSTNNNAGGGGGGWGWGGWGVDSLLSTATAGISTLTSTVSQGISTVSNALESSIGAPEPEELAKRNLETIEERSERSETTPLVDNQEANRPSPTEGAFVFDNIMSGVNHITKFVENTGSKVITGGLDTLETIGKKTMEVLQDGDPGLVKKRAMLGLDPGQKPVLSQVLREAKTRADEEDMIKEQKREAKEVHYETLFDDFEGLVHLEALEMLSRQVGMRIEERLRGATPDQRLDMKETLQQVAELCEMPDEEEESEEASSDSELTRPQALLNRLREATQDLGIPLQFQPLVKQYEQTLTCLESEEATEKAVYKRGVSALAQCTALCVEVYHKAAELLLVKPRRSTADEADALTQATAVLTRHVGELAADFTRILDKLSTDDNRVQVNTYVTNLFLEAGNSATYIQNAFHLTLPILQIGAA